MVDTTEATTQADLFAPERAAAAAGPRTRVCNGRASARPSGTTCTPTSTARSRSRPAASTSPSTSTSSTTQPPKILRRVCVLGRARDAGLHRPARRRRRHYTIQIGGLDAGTGPGRRAALAVQLPVLRRPRRRQHLRPARRLPDQPGVRAAGGCPPELRATPKLTAAPTCNAASSSELSSRRPRARRSRCAAGAAARSTRRAPRARVLPALRGRVVAGRRRDRDLRDQGSRRSACYTRYDIVRATSSASTAASSPARTRHGGHARETRIHRRHRGRGRRGFGVGYAAATLGRRRRSRGPGRGADRRAGCGDRGTAGTPRAARARARAARASASRPTTTPAPSPAAVAQRRRREAAERWRRRRWRRRHHPRLRAGASDGLAVGDRRRTRGRPSDPPRGSLVLGRDRVGRRRARGRPDLAPPCERRRRAPGSSSRTSNRPMARSSTRTRCTARPSSAPGDELLVGVTLHAGAQPGAGRHQASAVRAGPARAGAAAGEAGLRGSPRRCGAAGREPDAALDRLVDRRVKVQARLAPFAISILAARSS